MTVKVFKLHLVHNNEPLKAIACITVGEVAINDIRVVERFDRFFVNMPSRPDKTGKPHDTVHPTTSELRLEVEKAVIKAYFDALEEQNTHNTEE